MVDNSTRDSNESAVNSVGGSYRIGNLVLTPLGLLHAEGWGPDSVEIDAESGDVRFVYEGAVE